MNDKIRAYLCEWLIAQVLGHPVSGPRWAFTSAAIATAAALAVLGVGAFEILLGAMVGCILSAVRR